MWIVMAHEEHDAPIETSTYMQKPQRSLSQVERAKYHHGQLNAHERAPRISGNWEYAKVAKLEANTICHRVKAGSAERFANPKRTTKYQPTVANSAMPS